MFISNDNSELLNILNYGDIFMVNNNYYIKIQADKVKTPAIHYLKCVNLETGKIEKFDETKTVEKKKAELKIRR